MDKAKAAVSDFMHKSGHNDTTVHEKVAPAVTQETVKKHHHTEQQVAVDKEVHQDHYHTSVQPVFDKQVLPEKHVHEMAPVDHKVHHHGREEDVDAKLRQEAAKFTDVRREGETRSTSSTAPTIAGEHVHHHVHETIQPVVQRETIQPTVVHTTVPVHEVHHNEAKHHSTTALPAVSLTDFQRQGGSLSGREERYDAFEGEPKPVGSTLGGSSSTGLNSSSKTSGTTHHSGTTGSGYNDTSRTGASSTTGTTGTTGSTTGNKGPVHNSSLLNKLDPRVDADGDGKRGLGD